jgi:plastocyanin
MKLTHALVAALVLAAPAAAQKPTTVVPIRLFSFGYSPSPIALAAGQPVTMVFTNDSGMGHEFKAPGFFHASRIISGDVEEEGAIELKGHQSASVTLIPARGTYKVHCGHFMHKQLGMQTTITVQ